MNTKVYPTGSQDCVDAVRAWEYQPDQSYGPYGARNGPIGRPKVDPNRPEVVYAQLSATGFNNLRKRHVVPLLTGSQGFGP